MSKLWFRYGAMGCSKTANALMVAFNYEEKGLTPLVLKPRLDDRDGKTIIKSRIGLYRACEVVEDFIFPENWELTAEKVKAFDCIIVDEVQFCKPEEIKILWRISKELNIPVICYGLLIDFCNKIFPGSQELIVRADIAEELKTVCWCGKAAKCNARIDADGNVIKHGEQIFIGGNESYISLCLKHYDDGDIGPEMRSKFRK